LTEQIKENEHKIQGFMKEKLKTNEINMTAGYATPLKAEIYSNRFEGDMINPSTKISQMMSDEKKGKTCTTATKQNLEWSAF
jgi:hypothetical protein